MYIFNKKIVISLFIAILGFMNISCKGHHRSGSSGTANSLYKFTALSCSGGRAQFSVISTADVDANCSTICQDISNGTTGTKGTPALTTFFTIPPNGTFNMPSVACDGITCQSSNFINCVLVCTSSSAFGNDVKTAACS